MEELKKVNTIPEYRQYITEEQDYQLIKLIVLNKNINYQQSNKMFINIYYKQTKTKT